MHLTQVHCRNFRCLAEVSFAPARRLSIIRGANAQGKTSLLEAVHFLALTRSHRTTSDAELVRHGEEAFHLELRAERVDRSVDVAAHYWKGSKRFRINGVPQTRLSDLLGRVNLVFFAPADIELVQGGAAVRRRFLDMELSQLHPAYLNALQQYRQVLRQRNELLRASTPDEDLIAVWDVQLAQHGRVLVETRAAYVEELSGYSGVAYGRLAEQEALALRYQPNVSPGEDLEAVLRKVRPSDIRRRASTRGPHLDDLELLIGGHPARAFGSQGQQKSAALSLKLAELGLVQARLGEYPVLLLDEVVAELDEARVRRLFEAIPTEVQCVVTTTEAPSTLRRFGGDGAEFVMDRGALTRTGQD
jgi:DNA replication and repair protein RecF